MSTPRLAALDGLRLLAAVAVAVFHLGVGWRIDGVRPPAYFLPTASHWAIYGFLGVELFFLISGFVICMSAWGRTLGGYFVSRASRLYPAYWVCIAITVTVLVALPISGGVPVEGLPDLPGIAVNLTMLQQPLGVASVDTVYWTLFVELRFYLLFAIVVWAGTTYRRVVLFCAVWLTVAVLAPAWKLPFVELVAVPEYASYFVAGMAMYLIYRFGPTPLLYGVVGMAWLVSMSRLGRRLADVHPGFEVPSWPGYLLVTLCFVVMLAIAHHRADLIQWRGLTVAGALTYPFYLLHQRIGYTLIRTAHNLTHAPPWVLITGAMLVVGGLAWLVHRYIERPLTPLLRGSLNRGIAATRAPALSAGRQ
ncbi:acyltransferase family protein [Paractinoplanes ferrugineus]|uniref:acyltransferase family protein n=1 Tax=Paractinoplanes ferrugineus TaxID=113564 RepID=UPI001EF3873C|nr:acyltransferase [Actinoplanes ferrugineus]